MLVYRCQRSLWYQKCFEVITKIDLFRALMPLTKDTKLVGGALSLIFLEPDMVSILQAGAQASCSCPPWPHHFWRAWASCKSLYRKCGFLNKARSREAEGALVRIVRRLWKWKYEITIYSALLGPLVNIESIFVRVWIMFQRCCRLTLALNWTELCFDCFIPE